MDAIRNKIYNAFLKSKTNIQKENNEKPLDRET